MKRIILLVFLLQCIVSVSFTQKKAELSSTPPMGWNSWNWFGKQNINEQVVRKTIDLMVELGLKDAGYNYVVIDGGWRDTNTGPNGELLPHPTKFPNGIKVLADYAHSKGLKFGLHTVPGTHDCGGDPVGGYNREELHIRQFVDWGVDFIKLDLCKQTIDTCSNCPKSATGWSEQNIKNTYLKWSRLLYNSGRDILYSVSSYRFRDWNTAYCNMSRTTQDLKPYVNGGAFFNSPLRENKGLLSVMALAEFNNKHAAAAGNGYWNDADMMAVSDPKLSFEEQQSHFALWCMMSSPLFLGNDLSKVTPAELKLITDKDLIAINQDNTEQGKLEKTVGQVQFWMKKLKNNKLAFFVLNIESAKASNVIVFDAKTLGLEELTKFNDLISKQTFKSKKNQFSIALKKHQSVLFVVKQ